MTSLEQIIIEEFESSHLDFKSIQYKKEKFEDFLVDVISMANANTKNAKYIVIGVKAYPNGQKNIVGISENFIDEATYQQLINDNVEPEIKVDYFPVTIDNVPLAVFHISDCESPPYMLRKDYGKLKRGDTFIRKGTHQTRVTRKDIDNFFRLTYERKNRIEDIQVSCQINDVTSTNIKPISELLFPSDKAAEKIKKILVEKEEKLARIPGHRLLLDIDMAQIGGTPYEQRSTRTLRENLEKVKETYYQDDLYYLYEERSYKLNFQLSNTGKVYLEDASLEIEVEKTEGLLIPNEIVNKPDNRSWLYKLNSPVIPTTFGNIHFPEITETDSNYRIFENIGNIKHLIPSPAFKTPIRLVITESYPFDSLKFNIKIFGKELEKPIVKTLELRIIK